MAKKKVPICPNTDDIDQLSAAQMKLLLTDLMTKLDDYDMQDWFGTEGWRHMFGYED